MITIKIIGAAFALTFSTAAMAAAANCCADMACCKEGADCCKDAEKTGDYAGETQHR